MISIQADKRLALLLPSINKALAEAVNHATPEQLKALGEQSDLKGVFSSLFSETLYSEKSDKVLLDILKNATVFKEMGSFTKDIQNLQTLSKAQNLPQKIEAAITQFIKSMEGLDASNLKAQISNSGVFLESKLAQPVDAKGPLKGLLQELQSLLQKSTTQEAKQLGLQVERLIPELKGDDTKVLHALSQSVEKITATLQALHVKADVMLSKPMQGLLERLQKSIEPQKTIDIKSLLPQLQELYMLVLQSKNPTSSSLLSALEKIVQALRSIEQNTPILQHDTKIPQEIHKVIDALHVNMKKVDPIVSKEMMKLTEKLSVFTKPDALSAEKVMNEHIIHDMKANLLQLGDEIRHSPTLQNSEMAKIVDKLSFQIDYYQLYSHLNNSSSLYFPFVWDQLEEGSLSIKQSQDKKFYCEINLNLKDHGELRVMLALYDDNQINIHAFCESESLKNDLREGVTTLREAFIKADLTLREVRFFDKERPKTQGYEADSDNLEMGFEVKV